MFYFLRNHGVISPMSRSIIVYISADSVLITTADGASFTGTPQDLSVVTEEGVKDIISAMASGIPYR